MKSFLPPFKANANRANGTAQQVSQPVKPFVDNRPTAIAQRKLQTAINASMKAPIQRQVWLTENAGKEEEESVQLTEKSALKFLQKYDITLTDHEKSALKLILNDPTKRAYKQSKSGAKELYEAISAFAKPIATCSFHYRYHDKGGNGALKYDPVNCAPRSVMNVDAVDIIRRVRSLSMGAATPTFTFETAIEPKYTKEEEELDRKMLVVPSVGCPDFLTDKDAVAHLQWAKYPLERPTVLMVHKIELKTYKKQLSRMLKKIGVGLVGWSSEEDTVGFGASRRAAQEYPSFVKKERKEVILCDVNTTFSQDVADGYDTGDETDGTDRSIKAIKGPGKYCAAGFGTGIPWFDYDEQEDILTRTDASRGGDTRPIEQVVIVGNTMQYDPCFITSSEDADLTHALLAQEGPLHEKAVTSATFKYTKPTKRKAEAEPEELSESEEESETKSKKTPKKKVASKSKGEKKTKTKSKKKPKIEGKVFINKVEVGSKFLSTKYMSRREEVLKKLAYEDHILINYRKTETKGEKIKNKVMTIGDLAQEIADQHGKKPEEIRSLILEKIMVEAKRRQRPVTKRVRVATPKRARVAKKSAPKSKEMSARATKPRDIGVAKPRVTRAETSKTSGVRVTRSRKSSEAVND